MILQVNKGPFSLAALKNLTMREAKKKPPPPQLQVLAARVAPGRQVLGVSSCRCGNRELKSPNEPKK
jgi:hypothetical protein